MMSQPGNPGFFASARIMWQEFGIAFCLVLVLEGILPFLCPRPVSYTHLTLPTILRV